MYKIIGADGKEYGPMDVGVLQQWLAEGRINAQTQAKETSGTEWKAIAEIPELKAALFAIAAPSPPPLTAPPVPPGQRTGQEKGLAVVSLVLGILSLVCFGFLAGIPAVICGHLARNRSRLSPAKYGGAGLALGGLVTGYVGIAMTLLVFPAMLLPALARAKDRAQRINCVNNMKQVGLAFRVWALDHQDQFPFNVSTNAGGTKEFCSLGTDGFDRNPAIHLQVMSNELSTPKILVCPADSSKQPASTFQDLASANVSYQLHTSKDITDSNPALILAVCPKHGSVLLCDGTVQSKSSPRR